MRRFARWSNGCTDGNPRSPPPLGSSTDRFVARLFRSLVIFDRPDVTSNSRKEFARAISYTGGPSLQTNISALAVRVPFIVG
jgi:hypothetical protein